VSLVALPCKKNRAKSEEGKNGFPEDGGIAGLLSRAMILALAENTSGLAEPWWTWNGSIEMAF
jgi:hypothetical protein